MADFTVHCTVLSNYGEIIVYKNALDTNSPGLETSTYWLTIKDIANIILKHQQPNAIRATDRKIMIPLSSVLYIFSKMEMEDFIISFVLNTLKNACMCNDIVNKKNCTNKNTNH